MELNKKDRLVLANQYLILEKLDPEQAEHYARVRKAIESGYTLHYEWLTQHLSDEMTEEECRDVLNILEMFSFIKYSFDEMSDKGGIRKEDIAFPGFDGNNESEYLSFANFLVEDEEKFQVLGKRIPNSHMPTLKRYRRMLENWNELSDKHHLGAETIRDLLSS